MFFIKNDIYCDLKYILLNIFNKNTLMIKITIDFDYKKALILTNH
jgi:hypothetical protein